MEKIRCVNCMNEITGDVCPHCGYKEGDTEQTTYGLKRNSILHGKYLIGNVLGQGGFGITYIGLDIVLEIKVAIKEYFPMGYVSRDYTQSNQIVWNTMREGQEQWKKGSESFLKEARKMAQLDVIPEIVRVRDTFMENNTSYIVMDYVEGETLKSWLLKNGTMKLSDCVEMLSPLMQSLNKIHKRGLIHRDISPDNIMLQPDGKVRLLDLGAAKDLSIESNGTSSLVTKKGFSPSEQYMESGRIGTWTDVYALSATIYYCITGKLVSEAMERLAMEREMGNALKFDVPLMESLSGNAMETLQEGLAIRPEDRIQTVEELEQRLQKAIQPEPETENPVQIPALVPPTEPATPAPVPPTEPATPAPVPPTEPATPAPVPPTEPATPAPVPLTEPATPASDKTGHTMKKKYIFGIAAAAVLMIAVAAVSIIVISQRAKESASEEELVKTTSTRNEKSSEIVTDKVEDTEIADNTDKVEDTEIADNTEMVMTKDNILKKDFRIRITSTRIASITFMDTLDEMPDDAWDASEKQDGSVMAWTVINGNRCDLYIGGDGGVDGIEGNDCLDLFADCSNVKKIDFNNCFDTSKVTDMRGMFSECKNLTELDVSGFDTSNVTNMRCMFSGCTNLTKLNVSSFDTSNVTNMRCMFSGCENLTELDVSSFDTSKVGDMYGMFSKCKNLTELDVSHFDTSNVTDMSHMFSMCTNLTKLNVSSFDTSKVTDMSDMFSRCRNLTELNVSNFDTSNVTEKNMSYMFLYCGITAEEAGLKTN